jgi:uncharacterized protein (AIM24 family)
MVKQRGGSAAPAVPDVSKVPVPASAGVGTPESNAKQLAPNSAVSSSGVSVAGIDKGPFSNLGAAIENHSGFDILRFNISPGASVITNQETMSYMDGGLSTSATTGSGGIFSAIFRGFTGSSVLQNAVVNPTQNVLKMVLSPLLQGSIVQVDIKAGETWRFQDKSFIAATPNLNVSGNVNIFSNFRMMFVGENLMYTTVSANQGTAGTVWVSSFGAVEKHDIAMGTGSTVPLFINNGCFLGMIDHDATHNYWSNYVSVGTSNGMFNAMFTQLGWVMKIQDSVPTKGPAKCTVLTQSLNPHNFEKFIANIAQQVVNKSRGSQSSQPSFLQSGVGPSASSSVLGTAAVATAAAAGTAAAIPYSNSSSRSVNMNPMRNSTSSNSSAPAPAPAPNAPAPAPNAPAPNAPAPASNAPSSNSSGGTRRRRYNRKSNTRRR